MSHKSFTLFSGALVMSVMSFLPYTDGFYAGSLVLLWLATASTRE